MSVEEAISLTERSMKILEEEKRLKDLAAERLQRGMALKCCSPSPYSEGLCCQLESGHEHSCMDENGEAWMEVSD